MATEIDFEFEDERQTGREVSSPYQLLPAGFTRYPLLTLLIL
jgi:hypothetical protein